MIDAATSLIGRGVTVADTCRIVACDVMLGDEVVIEDGVTISCDRLQVGARTRIGAGTHVICPDVRLGEACTIGQRLHAELNERWSLGRLGEIGHDVRITGLSMDAGDYLWLTDSVIVGGGGARGPHASLTIGARSAIMDRCFINLSEPVTIGSDTALSNGVTILTHSLWQPALFGGTTIFAATHIGSRNILYVNAIIAPGVTTGDDVTVAAGALVLQDVPDGATAVGNPARIVRSARASRRELNPKRQDAIVRDALQTYAEALPVKGARVEDVSSQNSLVVTLDAVRQVIRYFPPDEPSGDSADITLGFDDAPGRAGRCHFNLSACTMTGEPSTLSEDLRDHLRRRTIRIFTDRPFRPLPPANLARLRERLRRQP